VEPCSDLYVDGMLATISEETAQRVAEDVRDFGHGYLRVDREGRIEHVPAPVLVSPRPPERRRSAAHE
jgi:hypothetical protein